MSNRLGGKQGTAYMGTNANQPPNMHFMDRPPTAFDISAETVRYMDLIPLMLNEMIKLNERIKTLEELYGSQSTLD
jgi:hypothetical protein